MDPATDTKGKNTERIIAAHGQQRTNVERTAPIRGEKSIKLRY